MRSGAVRTGSRWCRAASVPSARIVNGTSCSTLARRDTASRTSSRAHNRLVRRDRRVEWRQVQPRSARCASCSKRKRAARSIAHAARASPQVGAEAERCSRRCTSVPTQPIRSRAGATRGAVSPARARRAIAATVAARGDVSLQRREVDCRLSAARLRRQAVAAAFASALRSSSRTHMRNRCTLPRRRAPLDRVVCAGAELREERRRQHLRQAAAARLQRPSFSADRGTADRARASARRRAAASSPPAPARPSSSSASDWKSPTATDGDSPSGSAATRIGSRRLPVPRAG